MKGKFCPQAMLSAMITKVLRSTHSIRFEAGENLLPTGKVVLAVNNEPIITFVFESIGSERRNFQDFVSLYTCR